jgi:hypothetical protein
MNYRAYAQRSPSCTPTVPDATQKPPNTKKYLPPNLVLPGRLIGHPLRRQKHKSLFPNGRIPRNPGLAHQGQIKTITGDIKTEEMY